MFAAVPGSRLARDGPNWAMGFVLLLWLPVVAQGDGAPNAKDDEPTAEGTFITVRNPITTEVVNRTKVLTEGFLEGRKDLRNVKIIYDFNPDGLGALTTDYGPCRDLAEFLLHQQNITTVAFVRDEVSGHAVLPVLACKEIVMAKKARLGAATRDQANVLAEDQLLFYRHVAKGRGRKPEAVLRMVDKDTPLAGAPADLTDLYSSTHAEKFGLCDLIRETRQQVSDAYRLPASSLRGDPLQGRSPNAWRIVVNRPIDKALKETLERRIKRAIARGANFIVLQLECGGGETEVPRDLADFLRTRRDDKGEETVRTVAFIAEQARDTATFLALGCNEIVMDHRAQLGGFESFIKQHPTFADAMGQSLENLADNNDYPGIIARAMLDPKMELFRVVSQKGREEHRIIDAKELEEDRQTDRRWRVLEQVKESGRWLVLDADKAQRLGLAKFVFKGNASDRLTWLKQRYGLDQIKDADPDWLDDVATFLCHPVVSIFLVIIGITGLILELKIPGIGLPGVLSALSFVLYFWAHSQMAGHLTMLAILLFLLGLILIGLEIFVVPGLGITGVSGILLVVVSLGLVTLVKKPETTEEWMQFGGTLSTIGVTLATSVAAAFVFAYYLPNIPYARRLILVPPSGDVGEYEEESPETPAAPNILGAIGEAATPLRPAGKARIGEAYVDVVAEGDYVMPGARVQVIEIEGNRIVVKEV